MQPSLTSALAAVLALLAAVSTATDLGAAQAKPPASSQICRQCRGCGKQFRVVPNEIPPGACPACGFSAVQSATREVTITDWSRTLTCGASQQPPRREKAKPPKGRQNAGARGTSGMDVKRAAETLNAIAAGPTGYCAKHVQRALKAGGVSGDGHPARARDYGRYLISKGFIAVPDAGYTPHQGDVVVIQPSSGRTGPGHIAMYDGVRWISDYRQRTFWGGGAGRPLPAAIKFYRP